MCGFNHPDHFLLQQVFSAVEARLYHLSVSHEIPELHRLMLREASDDHDREIERELGPMTW